MEWRDLVVDGYRRVAGTLEEYLKGLTPQDMDQQPRPDSNSIGWLAWHTTRGQDSQIAALMGEPQLWISEGWHQKFGRPADPKDTGFGHAPADVAAFKSPPVETQLAYQRAVLARTERYLASLTPDDLARQLNEPWFQPLPTVGVRLVSIMADNLQHVGQIGYARGLLKGKGWLPY